MSPKNAAPPRAWMRRRRANSAADDATLPRELPLWVFQGALPPPMQTLARITRFCAAVLTLCWLAEWIFVDGALRGHAVFGLETLRTLLVLAAIACTVVPKRHPLFFVWAAIVPLLGFVLAPEGLWTMSATWMVSTLVLLAAQAYGYVLLARPGVWAWYTRDRTLRKLFGSADGAGA